MADTIEQRLRTVLTELPDADVYSVSRTYYAVLHAAKPALQVHDVAAKAMVPSGGCLGGTWCFPEQN